MTLQVTSTSCLIDCHRLGLVGKDRAGWIIDGKFVKDKKFISIIGEWGYIEYQELLKGGI